MIVRRRLACRQKIHPFSPDTPQFLPFPLPLWSLLPLLASRALFAERVFLPFPASSFFRPEVGQERFGREGSACELRQRRPLCLYKETFSSFLSFLERTSLCGCAVAVFFSYYRPFEAVTESHATYRGGPLPPLRSLFFFLDTETSLSCDVAVNWPSPPALFWPASAPSFPPLV